MKIYLVGGAVRDKLLNYPIKERDWVVVGGSREEMLQQGYQQVGKDFPVFLHPVTHEEYALARKERKSGLGYYGFDCDFGKEVSLEEDLQRRDLTINAMALDEQGHIIDPYQGLKDIEAKILRHVSPAFVEDPVRVLRLARFAARYHHLGFRVANETRCLMVEMGRRKELHHLVPERIWQELSLALEETHPEIFITTLRDCGALEHIFPELDVLFGVPNPPKYHPEIDSGIHTLWVLQAMASMSQDPMLRFAALVHDLGKGNTSQALWPHHYGHEERGVALIEAMSQRLKIPSSWRQFAKMVSEYHLQIHRLMELRPATVVKVMERTDAFRRPEQFDKLLQVCEADARGKLPRQYEQATRWRELHQKCLNIDAKPLVAQGYQGEAIKNELQRQRILAVDLCLNEWKHHEK